MNQKKTFIRDLRPGQDVSDIFALAQAQRKEAKNGPYWQLTVVDSSGSIEARIWYPHSQQTPFLRADDFVYIRGQTALFKDQLQLNISDITQIDAQAEGLDLRDFILSSVVPPAQLLENIENILHKELTYAPWRTLCRKLLQDQALRSMLFTAPGAKAVHHAYAGGLLEHTLGVMQVCLALCSVYPQVDKELVLVGALLHDVGKAVELSHGISREYTDAGRLLGHIYLGLELVEPFLAKAKIPADLALHLKHLLISHHGELEFGSPRRPKTTEAFILHYADNLDAKIHTIEAALEHSCAEEAEASVSSGYWSEYQRSLSRYVFQPQRTPGEEKPAEPTPVKEPAQKQRLMQLGTPT